MKEHLNDMFIEMLTTRIIVDYYCKEKGKLVTKLISCDELELKIHEFVPYLTLQDITKQLEKRFGEQLVIDVWEEQGSNGHIYRYGNHGKHWSEHGKTGGFA